MALNFPSNPQVNDTYTVGITTWTWDGVSWNSHLTGWDETPPVVGPFEVRYIDYDGTVLSTQFIENGQNATPPTLPDHSDIELVFQEWNNSSLNITRDRDIGATYETSDGKTHLYISVVNEYFRNVTIAGGGTGYYNLDWGDGSAIEYNKASAINHTYASVGDYVIKYWAYTPGTLVSFYTYNADYNLFGFRRNFSIQSVLLKKVFMGNDYNWDNSFYNTFAVTPLKILTLPKTARQVPDHTDLTCIIVPNNDSLINGLDQYSQLKTYGYFANTIVLPDNLVRISSVNGLSLRRLILPNHLQKITTISGPCLETLGWGDISYFTSTSITIGVRLVESLPKFTSLLSININYMNNVTSLDLSALTSVTTLALNSPFSLESIILPPNLITLGNTAFRYAYNLKSIILPQTLTSIGSYAFNCCYRLEEIVIPPLVLILSDNVFQDCMNLKTVTYTSSTMKVYGYAFSGCYNLESFDFSRVTYIGGYAFVNCQKILKVTLSSLMTSSNLLADAFQYMQGCVEFDLSQTTLNYISNGTFKNISYQYISIKLPNTVHTIYGNFIQSTNIYYLTLPSSLQTILSQTFYCTYLHIVDFPQDCLVTNIPSQCFMLDSSWTGRKFVFRRTASLITMASVDAFNGLGVSDKIYVPDYYYPWDGGVVLPVTEPETPITGDRWFNETTNTLYTYLTDSWDAGVVLQTAIYSATSQGEQYFNEVSNKIYTSLAQASMVNAYKAATNWSSKASYIYGLSQLTAL